MKAYCVLWVVFATVLAACSSSVTPRQPSPGIANSLSAHHARVYVVNPPSNSVTVYDESGNLLNTRGGFRGLNTPTSITFDAADQLLYVLGRDNRGYCCSVVAYTTEGNQVASCGFHVDGSVYGIGAFDPVNRLLYVLNFTPSDDPFPDGGTGFVLAYDRSGRTVSTSGHFSMPGGQPSSLAVDTQNHRIYITVDPQPGDIPGGGDIEEFDENGNPLTTYGSFMDVERPIGITFDPANDELYVVNRGGFDPIKSVTAFDQMGNEVMTSGSFKASNPVAVAFDPSNRLLYVANLDNTIQAFDENGNLVPTPGGFPGISSSWNPALVVVP